MIVRKKYVLGDYAKCSTGRLAAPFASISNMESYEFAEKLYVDDKHRATGATCSSSATTHGSPEVRQYGRVQQVNEFVTTQELELRSIR